MYRCYECKADMVEPCEHLLAAGISSPRPAGSASDRLEKAACRVLNVWARDRREREDWIAALADLWASVHEYRQNNAISESGQK